MTERRETVSKNLENVICTMGSQSKKPNAVHLAIDDGKVLEALDFWKDKKKGIERTEGLVRIEAVFVYVESHENELEVSADEMKDDPLYQDKETPEEKIESMNNDLDEVLEEEE